MTIRKPGGVSLTAPLTAFGELKVAEKTPQIQIKFPYDFVHPDIGQILTNKVGSNVAVSSGQAIVTAAGVAESFSQIRSKSVLRYGPGQGAEMLGTCVFTAGQANSSQTFGAGDDDEGFFFGYNGTEFGVLHKSRGSLEIQQLTITSGASSSGNITITLDGDATNVAVTVGDTVAEICEKVTAAIPDFLNAARGWEVINPDDNTLEFLSSIAEPAPGVFSFVAGGTGVTTSAFSVAVAGIVPVDTWIAQTDWNRDKANGKDELPLMDFTKGNVFNIQFQYLGYGAITYSVENPKTGMFVIVHQIEYANAHIVPSLINPTLNLTLIAKTEVGYAGPELIMKTGSMAGFVEGKEAGQGPRRSVSDAKLIGTTETVLLVLHNVLDFNGRKNKVNVFPDFMSFSSESNKPVELILYKGVTRIDGGAALVDTETNVSVVQHSKTGTTKNGGARILTLEIGGNSGGSRGLDMLGDKILPGERWVVTARVASGAASNITVSYTWIERI